MNLNDIKEKLLKYWFVISALALAVMYALLDRRGRQLDQLHADAQRSILAKQLEDIQTQSRKSEFQYALAQEKYLNLRARHGDLLTKLGVVNTRPNDTNH